MLKKCKICGKQFKTDSWKIKNGRGKYCSKDCMKVAFNTQVTRVCKYCGVEFKTYPSRVKKGWGLYCSHRCHSNFEIGENSPCWLGGWVQDGYKWITKGGKRILEHRYVLEQVLGRKLEENEIVHHLDGNKLNNHPENLQIMTHRDHAILHSNLRKA